MVLKLVNEVRSLISASLLTRTHHAHHLHVLVLNIAGFWKDWPNALDIPPKSKDLLPSTSYRLTPQRLHQYGFWISLMLLKLAWAHFEVFTSISFCHPHRWFQRMNWLSVDQSLCTISYYTSFWLEVSLSKSIPHNDIFRRCSLYDYLINQM